MYDLHNLGWNSFQQLCLTVAREVLGQTVQSFLSSRDAGRDGAFAGTWAPRRHEALCGQFVIQCKFTGKPNYVLKLSDLGDEVAKVKRLVRRGRCDVYVLMTNAGVSGVGEEEIETLFRTAGAKAVLTLGADWMSQQIRETKRLRMLVPRVYGLGDLGQILDERAYAQARAVLETMSEDLAKVVVTDAYRRAAEALDKYGFVLLIGEPAAGKTTIASMLAMAAIDQWDASTLKLEDPAKVAERWNPDEPSQFFWIDDAFGVTQYEDFLVRGWNHVFPQIRTMLRRGVKVVMTSRDYIYNRARKDLKEGAFPLLREAQVVIDVHSLSTPEKQQILYNHLKLGKQSREFRSEIKPHLEMIAGHARFIPETARRLADPLFTKGLFIDSYYLGQFVEKREQLLQEVLNGLDRDSRAALALIYMRNDRLESPIALQPSETEALERLSSTLGGCVAALEALNGSLVLLTHVNGESAWRFKHPTIGDAYAATLVQSAELLGIYIQGSTPEKLVAQVTCGDVGIEKAVVVPRVLFPLMLERIGELAKSKNYKSPFLSTWGGRWTLNSFLAHRCSREFLDLYITATPGFLERIATPGLMLSAMAEVGLVAKLHKMGLLPEENRLQFIETVSRYAVDGEDLSAMSSVTIRTVFKDDEFEALKERVRSELVPRLDEVRRDVESNHTSGSPEEHAASLMESFDTLAELFGDDAEAVRIINHERSHAQEWVGEHTPAEPHRKPRQLGSLAGSEKRRSSRSVFDDIDDDPESEGKPA